MLTKLSELALTDYERTTLQRWARRAKSSQILVWRRLESLADEPGRGQPA
jgi:hypothetical protein